MSELKLTYFDIPGGRGEASRLALHIAGVAFEDDRFPFPEWAGRKGKTPFGGVPTLTVEGKGVLAESGAILTYIGRSHGLHPTDLWEAARHEMMLWAVEDLRRLIGPTLSIRNPDERKAARESLTAGPIPRWAGQMEKQIGDGPFVAGDTLQVVDLEIYVGLNWFMNGTLDHVPTDIFDRFPKLIALHQAVKSHEKVVAWYAK